MVTYWLKSRCSPSFSKPECRNPISGTALTTVSPSRVRMRRRVVCVAGCCGPKLSVQRKSFSGPSGGAMASANSNGMFSPRSRFGLTFGPREWLEIMALAPAAHRVVLAERERGELVGHEDAPRVRVAVELH